MPTDHSAAAVHAAVRSCGPLLIAARLGGWGATTDDVAHSRVDDAVLIVSELVSNAVRFCTAELELHLVAHRDRIEIAVTDDNSQPAEIRRPDPLVPGGQGLNLVQALAEHWGQRRHDGHKTVWAELSLPPGSALARNCRLPEGGTPRLTD